MGGRIARAQERPVERAVDRDGDGPQRGERVPVKAARRDDVDARGPALEDGSERRRATRTRGRG
jgi:hypothetical protein